MGCILGEMLGRRPMFPGKTFIHQLSLIFDVLGAPSREDVAHITHPEAKQFLAQQTHKMRQSFRDLYPSSSSESLDLLAHLLVFNPYRRISMNDALTMDFLWNCGLQESRVFPPVSDKCEFSFEEASITRYQLKQLILDEVSTFRKEQAQAMAPPPPPSTAAAAPKPPLVRQGSQKVSPTKPKAVAEEKGSVDAKGGEDNKDTDGDARLPRYLQSTASHSSRLTQGEGGGSRRASSVQRRGVSATSSTAAAKRANDEVSTRPPAHMVRTSENEAKKPHNNLTVESRPAPPVDDVSRMFDLESILHRINLGDRYHSNLNGLPPSPSRTQPARPPLANSDELGSPSPPRSPLRPLVGASSPSKKSLLATYTSPRRLGNKVTEDLAGEETDDDKTPEVRRSHTLTHALRNPSFLPAAKREGEREASLSPAPTMRDVSEPNSPMRVLHPAVPKSSSGLGRVHTMETSSPQLKYTIEKHSYADLAPSSGDDEVPEGVPLERNASIRRDHSGSTGGTSIPEEPEEVVKESETKTSSPQRMIVRGPNTIHTMATHVVNGPQRHHFERELAVGMGARERCKEEDYKKDQDREHEEQRKKKEKKITRPISPKFSVMSWQRKQAQGVSAGEGRAVEGPRQDLKKRAISTSRMRPNRSEL